LHKITEISGQYIAFIFAVDEVAAHANTKQNESYSSTEMIEPVRSSETSIIFYQIARCHLQADNILRGQRRENIKYIFLICYLYISSISFPFFFPLFFVSLFFLFIAPYCFSHTLFSVLPSILSLSNFLSFFRSFWFLFLRFFLSPTLIVP
jgi:hypothetical protein